MSKLVRLIEQGRGCSEKQRAAVRAFLRDRRKSLRRVGQEMARQGVSNKYKNPFHQDQVSGFLEEGLITSAITVCDPTRVNDRATRRRVRRAIRETMLRTKVSSSHATESDPYLQGRLEWWKLRKVGKKPNGSEYDKYRD